MQALPMMPVDRLEEAMKIIKDKAPKEFEQIIDDFTEFYVVGAKTGKVDKKTGIQKRRPPT
jgi:hypothetical protein